MLGKIKHQLTHTTGEILNHADMQELIRPMGIRKGTQHANHRKLSLGIHIPQHLHKGNRPSLSLETSRFSIILLTSLLQKSFHFLTSTRSIPPFSHILHFKTHSCPLRTFLLQGGFHKISSLLSTDGRG